MSTPSSGSRRPLSPFMIGPYYRPQLTSMLSILHRATGVALSLGALGFAWWLLAISAGPDQHALFARFARSVPGTLLLLVFVFSLAYHWFNGLRHLLWDVGWGFELPRAYATGWAVVALSSLSTLGVAWAIIAARSGA